MTTQEGATTMDETVGDKQLWLTAEAIVVGKFGTSAVYRELQRVRDEAITINRGGTMQDETVGDGWSEKRIADAANEALEDWLAGNIGVNRACKKQLLLLHAEMQATIATQAAQLETAIESNDGLRSEFLKAVAQKAIAEATIATQAAEIVTLNAACDEYEASVFFYQNSTGNHMDYISRLEQANADLHDTIAKQAARIEELEETLQFAASYKGIEGRGCPLCHYEDGVYIASCQMHKDMEAQAAHVEGLERMSEFWKRAALLAVDEFVERGDELDRLRAELAEAKLTTDEYAAVDKLMFNIGKYGYMISWLMPEPDDEEHYMNLVDAWWERQKEEGE